MECLTRETPESGTIKLVAQRLPGSLGRDEPYSTSQLMPNGSMTLVEYDDVRDLSSALIYTEARPGVKPLVRCSPRFSDSLNSASVVEHARCIGRYPYAPLPNG